MGSPLGSKGPPLLTWCGICSIRIHSTGLPAENSARKQKHVTCQSPRTSYGELDAMDHADKVCNSPNVCFLKLVQSMPAHEALGCASPPPISRTHYPFLSPSLPPPTKHDTEQGGRGWPLVSRGYSCQHGLYMIPHRLLGTQGIESFCLACSSVTKKCSQTHAATDPCLVLSCGDDCVFPHHLQSEE